MTSPDPAPGHDPVPGTDAGTDGGTVPAPAYYARSGGRLADWWTLLHPPYTVWHLSYVVLGAGLAREVDLGVLGLTVAAFLLAMGVGAHALDELQGRPLRTRISDRMLWAAAAGSVLAAVALGLLLAVTQTAWLWPLVAAVPVLVAGYNLELFGGRLHTDLGFAASWGGFPVVTGYVAQAPGWSPGPVTGVALVAVAATLLSLAQRRLSTPARQLRRHSPDLDPGDKARALAPLEAALRAMAWAHPLLAAGLVAGRLG
jgi:hypothetical protein